MFSPIFNYNNNILNNISGIEFARGIITQASLIPELDSTLKKKAYIQSVHASTAIDGNILTIEEVSKLLNGSDDMVDDKVVNEIMNYGYVLTNLDKYHDNGEITEQLIFDMYSEIIKNVSVDTLHDEKYRDVDIKVKDINTDRVRFIPPANIHVSRLMDDLISWINSSNEISPILVAGIVHYEFLRIHPFMEGNGITARALTNLILYTRGYDIKRYVTLEVCYNNDINAYLNALKTADDTFDLTHWLEYFTKNFLISVTMVKADVQRLLTISPSPNELDKQLILKDNQRKIINYIQEYGQITNKETAMLLEISSQASHNNLKKLQKMKIITRKGSGRSTFYVLNRVNEKLRKQLMK
ncbi:MAG: Fic family protein [Methanobacterium sp.]|uniref:Fic family protein n=1 Tax=Methanobacterium sp. TaxID=2164 RepID=UPI003C72EDF2